MDRHIRPKTGPDLGIQAVDIALLSLFRRRILTWYNMNGRHFPWRDRNRSDFEKVAAEILLQRTRAEVVATMYPHFIAQFSNWQSIADADDESLIQFLRPLGLWQRRAASIKKLAGAMVALNGIFPSAREEVEKLPGVGQYIASAIMLLCHGQPNPLLDVNMARVLERFFGPRKLADIRYDPGLQALARAITNHKRCLDINWAILDFASLVCRPRTPACPGCPMLDKCFHANRDDISHC